MKTSHLSAILTFFVLGCTNVSESDLIEQTPLGEEVTYANTVKAIMDNNCIGCHSNPPVNGAPIALVTYGNVVNAVEDSDLIERISSNDLDFVMPFGGPRLPQNLIDAVIEWTQNGFPED